MASGSLAAVITGASTGIGRHVALHLSKLGYNLTLLDINASALKDTAAAVSAQGSEVLEVVLDIRDLNAQLAAFQRHVIRFGRLDLVILNAGIAEKALEFYKSKLDEWSWERVLDIDLRALIGGAQIAGRIMEQRGGGGTILCVASAAGVFPVPVTPIYATAKAGVVHFVRSVAFKYLKRGIKVYSICPQFVDTAMGRLVVDAESDSAAREALLGIKGGLLSTQQVVDLMMDAVGGKYESGSALVLLQTGQVVQPFKRSPKMLRAPPSPAAPAHTVCPNLKAALAAWVQYKPEQYQQISVHTLSSDFKAATHIVSDTLPSSIPPGQVLVRHVCAGINASDVNYSAGRYHKSMKAAQAALPFRAGFEAVSVVAGVGPGVKGVQVGEPVASMSYGAFGGWGVVPANYLLPVPQPLPKYMALLVSGLTASIALEQAGRLKSGETVLVTAAAGGTGQFAVQLAKLAGCHVIATCGGPDKAALLRELGADRIVDYKRENLKAVLKQEYPSGVDVVWESVGGDMFDTAVKALAHRGRLIIIGMMSQYKEGWPLSAHPGLAERLLERSATVSGFFLFAYAPLWKAHFRKLLDLEAAGKLKVVLDSHKFSGLHAVYDAVDLLQSGASMGKVVVHLAEDAPTTTPACKL